MKTKSILGVLFLLAVGLGLLAEDKTPKLTDTQKLEIRNVQVQSLSDPCNGVVQRNQNLVNQTVQRVAKEAGVDLTKWQLQGDLNFVAVPEPPKPPAVQEKK